MNGSLDIYLDVILMENLVMNYLILWATGKFAKISFTNLRLFLGALLGGIYVILMVVFPEIDFYYSFPAKVLLSLLIISVTFSPENLKAFFKTLAVFYMITFVFAGASFACLYLNGAGGFVRNGIVYVFWNSKWATISLAAATATIVLRVFWGVVQSRLAKGQLLRKVEIFFDNMKAGFPALIDTGNSLHDPVTNLPVMVVEFSAIKEILPGEIRAIFQEGKEEDLLKVADIITSTNWYSRFRLIPFTSIGKENGILIGFKPDYVEINDEENGKRGVRDVIVGICNRALSRNRSYQALLNPDLL